MKQFLALAVFDITMASCTLLSNSFIIYIKGSEEESKDQQKIIKEMMLPPNTVPSGSDAYLNAAHVSTAGYFKTNSNFDVTFAVITSHLDEKKWKFIGLKDRNFKNFSEELNRIWVWEKEHRMLAFSFWKLESDQYKFQYSIGILDD